MPSAAVRRMYEDQIPSFMSVFDLGEDTMDQSGLVTVIDPKLVMGIEPTKLLGDSQTALRPPTLPPDSSAHKHNDSTSTQTSESAESSPTTTMSCTDSSDLSDPSPSSSPDSPVNLIPLSSFAPTPFGGLSSMAGLTVSDPALERPMTSPAPRRPKNMKGLSIQPPFSSLSSSLVSEPASPSFIKPPVPAMKRKPSQLSLKTNSNDLITRPTLEMPSSPSLAPVPPILQRRALKHSTSSPHMLSGLKSATFGPAGGMTIPTVLERNETGLSNFLRPPRPMANAPGLDTTIVEEDSPIRSQVANRMTFDVEPYHEVENNEDQKTPGYPDGPICIYPDHVFLYLEPTAEEASRFDLVINVAREVKNPFQLFPNVSRMPETKGRPVDDSPYPDTALTTTSFATAFEFLPDELAADTPTTPKAQSFKEPEYVHMPWDHNTDIGPDLMSLCELIDKRVKEGRKVLVHCQQGASRSASLIIAYGIYQNPALSVNDAYYAAQARSRWISPNMRLMYCLQDFQKDMSKRKSPGAGLSLWSGRSPTKHRLTLSADNIGTTSEPLTAPLPREDPADKATSPDKSPTRARGNSTPNRGEPISPGPSSAPSSFSWTDKEDERDPGKLGRFNLDGILKPTQPDSGFASGSSFSKPPPSPGFPSISISRQPPSPGLAPLSFGDSSFERPLMSPGFAPPPSFGSFQPPPPSFNQSPPSFGSFHQPESSSSQAPRSFGSFHPAPPPFHRPISFSRPLMSPGFAPSLPPPPPPPTRPAPVPLALSRPLMSPGIAPAEPFSFKPPPSPGFGSHRFGGSPEGFGFVPLTLSTPPRTIVRKKSAPEHRVKIIPSLPKFSDDDALMSPRVETMTNNPLRDPFSGLKGMQFVEVPPTPEDALFSPRESLCPRDPYFPFGRPPVVADPRSPPTKGETPIVRSIDEMI